MYDELYVKMDRENNREFILKSFEARTHKLSMKEKIIYHGNVWALPFGYDKKKKTIAIYGDRLGYMVESLAKEYNILAIGRFSNTDFKKFWKMGIHSVMYQRWNRNIAEGYINEDAAIVEKTIGEIEAIFRRCKVEFLIVTDLYVSIQRALCIAAHNVGIPVAYYEHTSIYEERVDEELYKFQVEYGKKFTDYYWFWGERNRQYSIGLNIANEDNSYVIGYPYRIQNNAVEKQPTILMAGDAAIHWTDHGEDFYKMVEHIYEYCKAHNIEFTYRPHPKELKDMYRAIAKKGMVLSKNTLQEDLDRNLVVIGGRTTVVLEAGIYGDVVFQVVWDEETVRPNVFENAYILEYDMDQITEQLQKAVDGTLGPKPIEEYNLKLTDVASSAAAAIEAGIAKYKNRK
ncbi:MAG: hypothetical protein ACI4S2_15435 [Lachnospiraceae bacterium]